MYYLKSKRPVTHQNGAVLITALVMLVILTLLGLSSISTTTMEERMAANNQEILRAFQAASSGLAMVFDDEDAFATNNTEETDGTGSDPFDKNANVGATGGGNPYAATTVYNSIYRQSTAPPRGSGWDSNFAYYHFNLSATGSTNTGANTTIHAGAYQVGRAQ
jgi:type IV pilus assembly protein PilX